MRERIISELAECYRLNSNEIIDIVNKYKKVNTYGVEIIKERKVVNKSSISMAEQIVLDYYKLLINRFCRIVYPNRTNIMTELMNIVPYLHLYNTYIIYKFDFKDFFYNVSPKKSYDFVNEIINLKPREVNFLKEYSNIEELIPGIGLHNSFIEISGQKFDFEVKRAFKNSGLLYYARYVDDCILILDQKVSKSVIENIIIKLMQKCFGNKLKINADKTQYYDSNDINYEINFLGYVFQKCQSSKKPYKFGISKKKLEKYKTKINDIILEFQKTQNIELLSFKLELIFKRVVYYGDRKNDSKYRWQVRGISDSYKELKRFIKNNEDYDKITNDTQKFLCKFIETSFKRNRIPIPAKINNQLKNKKFISYFINNKALLLHPKIGLNQQDLKKKLSIFGNESLDHYSYKELASKLLNRINP